MASVAYLISTFPVLEETFILGEMLELERQGVGIEIFSLRLPPPTAQQPEAQPLVRRTHYCPYLWRGAIWRSLAAFSWERPRTLALALWGVVRDSRDDPRCLLRAAIMIPKALAFARTMRELGIKHIHAHWATYPAAVTAFIARLLGLTYSVTAHAYDIYTGQRPQALARRLSGATFVATCSTANRDYLSGLVKRGRVTVHAVYHGVDTTRFRERVELAPSEPVDILAGCGTLDPRKGLRFLVDACAVVKSRGFPVRCRIVGGGPELEELRRQVSRLGVEDVVAFLPPVSQNELAEYYRSADIFVQPSIVCQNGDKDVIPNCLLEAMACGLAVVATSVSSIPEVIENRKHGLLVPEQSASAIADALILLIQEPGLRRELGEAARARVADRFDRKATTRKLRSLFRGVGVGSEQRVTAAGF